MNSQSAWEKTRETYSFGHGPVCSPSPDANVVSGRFRDPIQPFIAIASRVTTKSTPVIKPKKSIMSAPSFADNPALPAANAAFLPRFFDTHHPDPDDCSPAAGLADKTTNCR